MEHILVSSAHSTENSSQESAELNAKQSTNVAVRARVKLGVGQDSKYPAEMVSFTGLKDGKEHVAIIFKTADQETKPLVRIHSECLTGDVFHSSRCDCGEQLEEAIETMAEQGGIILYLRQEGRGIGLYNKLDAYVLQSQGMDTFAANNQLGFDDDLRTYGDAALMLDALTVEQITLLTNNPKKPESLREHGIDVVGTQRTGVHKKEGNVAYLDAKRRIGKHHIDM